MQPSNRVVHTHWHTVQYHRTENHKMIIFLYLFTYYNILFVWKRFCKNYFLHIAVFYLVTPWRLLCGHLRSGETWRLHFQADFHPDAGGSSVLRNICNHLSCGAVALKNRVWTVTALRTANLQHSISPFPLNFISAYYKHTTPTQVDEILLITPHVNVRVNNNVHSYTTVMSVECLWKLKCSIVIKRSKCGDCNY